MTVLNCLIILTMMALQIFNIVDFFEMLPAIHILIIINGFVFITSFIKNIDQSEGMRKILCCSLYLIIVLCCSLDMIDFYIWDSFGNGFFTRLLILALLICAGIVSVKKALTIYEANIEKRTYEKMAYSDNLTSLRNGRGFDDNLDAIDKDLDEVTIAYCDMNGIKYINDNFGHGLGDEALQMIADNLLELASKGHDTNTSKKDAAYRLGGDEFCVLCYDRLPKEVEAEIIDINKKLSSEHERFDYPIGISYGIVRGKATYRKSIRQYVNAADQKMYDYKNELYKTRSKYR